MSNLTGPQKALAGVLLGLIPPAFGLAIPGGLVGGSVPLDFEDILLATLPWSLSIAIVAWLWLAWDSADRDKFVASVVVLGVGAAFGLPLAKPNYKVTPDQSDSPIYYVAAKAGPSAIAEGGRVVAHNPRATAFAVLAGITIYVLFAYAILYGLPLWLAGLLCGVYLGHLLHSALTSSAKSPSVAGD